MRDFDMPGTQPFEQGPDLDTSANCATCHGNYDSAKEPYFNWQGSMMAHAARDPLFLANMALDSWVPRRFASLSERLTTQNGIMLVGGAALAALLYTRGSVQLLVVMYSINVFLTFSLSLLGMTVDTISTRREHPRWRRRAYRIAS